MRHGLFPFVVLWVAFISGIASSQLAGKKGKIQGESYVNLRSGPDLSHPPRAVLKRGEEVIVEGAEKSWYLISLSDGRRGYVHKTFINLLPSAEVKEKPKKQPVTQPPEEIKVEVPVATPSPRVEAPLPKGKPLPIIKVLEGKEWEILWWLGVALCIFIIGWICGGNYYLYRDRIKRTKLRF